MADAFTIEILDDGTLKITTDRISMANHGNADMLIRELIKQSGGEVVRSRKTVHCQAHEHFHEH